MVNFGRLKFESHLMVTGAIVVGRENDLFRYFHLASVQMLLLASLQTSRLTRTCSTYVRGRFCGSVFIIGSSMVNIERGCRTQHSCCVFGLELHLVLLVIAPCGS